MSGSKTKTVGGQAVSPLARDFTSFLGNALGQTTDTALDLQSAMSTGGPKGVYEALKNHQQQINNPTPQQDTTAFRDALTSLLTGGNIQQTTPINIQNLLGQNSNFQVSPTDMNNPQMQALKQIADQQNALNVANLRERFSQGGSAMGTPAAYAEASYNAQAAPQLINALAQAAQQNAQIQLQNQSLNNQNQQSLVQALLQNRGLDLSQQQLGQQGQIAALQQLFNSLNQANALGTSQAQVVQQPSGFQNFMSGLGGIAGLAGTLAGGPIGGIIGSGLGKIFSGGSTPTLSMPIVPTFPTRA